MGRITPEMIQRIKEEYKKDPNYERVAKKLKLNPKTVGKYASTSFALSRQPGDKEDNFRLDAVSRKRSRALELLRNGKSVEEVAIELGAPLGEMEELIEEHWALIGLEGLADAYKILGRKGVGDYLELFERMQSENMSAREFITALGNVKELMKVNEALNHAKSELEQVTSTSKTYKEEILELVKQNTQIQGKIKSLQEELAKIEKSDVYKFKETALLDIDASISRKDFPIAVILAETIKEIRNDPSKRAIIQNMVVASPQSEVQEIRLFKELRMRITKALIDAIFDDALATRISEGSIADVVYEFQDVDKFVVRELLLSKKAGR